jgi:hypothetical protein
MDYADKSGTKAIQSLPFVVEIATPRDLREVAILRASSYGKHMPALGAKLAEPEPADYEAGCEVFIARSKLDHTLLGTLRTHANTTEPLPLQASMRLPTALLATRMVETTRLCVKGSPGASVVRSALFKALFMYCLGQKVDWMMAAGRRPVDRIYDSLLFTDVETPGAFYPMAHANGVPHRVMCFSPSAAENLWKTNEHPLYTFVFETTHPDIRLAGAADLDQLNQNTWSSGITTQSHADMAFVQCSLGSSPPNSDMVGSMRA